MTRGTLGDAPPPRWLPPAGPTLGWRDTPAALPAGTEALAVFDAGTDAAPCVGVGGAAAAGAYSMRSASRFIAKGPFFEGSA